MQDIKEAIRLANVIIGNQQITGKRFNDLEQKINANASSLSQIIQNQNVLNKNIRNILSQLAELKNK